MQVDILRADVTETPSDAIIVESNALVGACASAGPIYRAAGPANAEHYLAAVKTNGGSFVTGQAVATPAGDLPAHMLIHAVIPVYSKMVDRRQQLITAYYAAFTVAERHNTLCPWCHGTHQVRSVTIAPLIGSFPKDVAADAAVEALRFYKARVIQTAMLVSLDSDFVDLVRQRLYGDSAANA